MNPVLGDVCQHGNQQVACEIGGCLKSSFSTARGQDYLAWMSDNYGDDA